MARTTAAALILVCMAASGCGTGRGYEWGHTPAGTFDSDPFNLAPFGSPAVDGNGILYTLRAGSIDPDHIYGWARKTKSYYEAVYDCLIDGCSNLSKGYFHVSFRYPDNWTTLPAAAKRAAAHESAVAMGQYLAFNDGLWHEVATWYGHRTFPLISDFESALSWEDLYSDRLGTVIAAEALNRPGDFNANVTRLTAEELKKRGLVDTNRARSITETMQNIAYQDDPLAKKILWRNLDIGTGDGQINPVVFPGFSDQPPIPLPAPTLEVLKEHGIEAAIIYTSSSPHYSTITAKSNITGPIAPAEHNAQILAVIKEDALRRGFRVFD